MSPYNVILYNAPLQALMACSLALYGDDPRGDPAMRFTFDLWTNRVLPAWRQIMGGHGGWHEGGEYVGIGIGQAIYELPAMWRSATREDLFASEPGIRGFLDFLVYRKRPDGTDFRWGDGGYFDRTVPDAIPLALEFRHAPAYSARPPGDAIPSSGHGDPYRLVSRRPDIFSASPPLVQCSRYRLLVARSGRSPDATCRVQGRGPLLVRSRLDQGLSPSTRARWRSTADPTGAGSDHHLNDDYQTIAHNTVTVSDPNDTVAAPGKDTPRRIANDGGQRRVGSGWGVEAAPLDRAEWEAKRDIYHTAEMGRLLDADGLAVTAADITPAYTNAESGNGTFSARTRRVERFWRIFGYDRVDDVIVVFDQVTSSNASFRKRWLLHTTTRPRSPAQVPRCGCPGWSGPRRRELTGEVLLPKEVGQRRRRRTEFFVDNKNYDENGAIYASFASSTKNGEPGNGA
jgi:hypothetical protein